MGRRGERLLLPWLEGHLGWANLFSAHCQHRIVWTRLLVLGLFQVNGQWDARVGMIVAALLHAGIAVSLGTILARRLGKEWENVILLALVPLFGLFFDWEVTLQGGFASQYYFLFVFSVLTLWGLRSHRPGTGRWWWGVVGALGVPFTVGSGPLAPAAVGGWMIGKLLLREGKPREQVVTLAASVGLAAAGFSLSLGVKQFDNLQATSVVEFTAVLAGFLSWPSQLPIFAPLAFLPFVALLCHLWFARRTAPAGSRAEDFLVPLGLWVILQAAVLAYARNRYQGNPVSVSRYMVVSSLGTLTNLGCLLELLRRLRVRTGAAPVGRAGRRATLAGVLGCLWLIFTLVQLGTLTRQDVDETLPYLRVIKESQRQNLAALVVSGDARLLLNKTAFDLQCEQPDLMARLLATESIRNILPTSIRLPLVLRSAEPTGFTTQPKILAGSGDVSEPTWVTPAAAERSVHFRSQPLPRSAPYLEFTVFGQIGTPEAWLALVSDDTKEVVWVLSEGRVDADGWRRVTVKTPPAPFHVEAAVEPGADKRFAFLNPREATRLSVIAGDMAGAYIPMFFAGFALWAGVFLWEKWRCSGGDGSPGWPDLTPAEAEMEATPPKPGLEGAPGELAVHPIELPRPRRPSPHTT